MSLVTTPVEMPSGRLKTYVRTGRDRSSRPSSQCNTPLRTTEVPTYFGPSDSRLFGVVHLPVDNQIRGGVLICGSLGKEGMDSARLHRILADGLARRGFAVLHFDYLGLGDSAFAQGRDDAVANWVASVGHALDYLTLIGAESITAIGIRAGCLILDDYLARSHIVDRVVYLDPYGSGRRYLRKHTALFRLSVGEDAVTPGEVSIIGGRLSVHAAANSPPCGWMPIQSAPVASTMYFWWADQPRPINRSPPWRRPRELIRLLPAVCRNAPGRATLLLPIPFTAVDSIVDWIDRNVPARTNRAVPQYLTTVRMPAEGPDGVDVVESIERIEPNGLFAIRTLPGRLSPTPAKTVLFFVTAIDLHIVPAREWVEL